MTKILSIMVVAGEASGDGHAAKLVRALREAEPLTAFDFFGAAGTKMRSEGVEPTVSADDMAIVGLAEIAAALPVFLRAYRTLKKAAAGKRPDAVILVDFPDFNLKLARWLRNKGFTVIYYISPQLWAWRKHRVTSVRKYVDLMLTILPFEKEWYLRHGVENVEYVGSPLAREVKFSAGKIDFCSAHRLDPERPIISLLPGSRGREIARILPLMIAAASETSGKRGQVQFVVATGSPTQRPAVRSIIEMASKRELLPKSLKIVENETYEALNASDAAAITSGTATLEAAILGTPMAVVYKTSAINYKILAPMIDVEHYGLVNLIAGKRVASEFIQDDLTPESLSIELLRLLDPDTNVAMRKELQVVSDKLGHGGASKRAAEAILKLIASKE